jgi:hypothetical protein
MRLYGAWRDHFTSLSKTVLVHPNPYKFLLSDSDIWWDGALEAKWLLRVACSVSPNKLASHFGPARPAYLHTAACNQATGNALQQFSSETRAVFTYTRTFKHTSRTIWFWNDGALPWFPRYTRVQRSDMDGLEPRTETGQNKPKPKTVPCQPKSIQGLPTKFD